jgi:hypothetical protein
MIRLQPRRRHRPLTHDSRYHKQHGHQTQQLHANDDGTFSIVNPETDAPYPGTLGMEKEKPFCCDICGKRYKNLNGLKYVSRMPSSMAQTNDDNKHTNALDYSTRDTRRLATPTSSS